MIRLMTIKAILKKEHLWINYLKLHYYLLVIRLLELLLDLMNYIIIKLVL